MSKSKTEKFEAIDNMAHVFQNFHYNSPKLIANNKEISHYGHWKQHFFQNEHPIVVELACGRGEYTIALAKANRNINYIGVDIKGNRIYTGAQLAIDHSLTNVCFIRTSIELLHHFIAPDEIDEVWITFPDPFPCFPDRKKRLISPRFLDYYHSYFATKPIIYHLKTDNFPLFRYAVGVLDGKEISILTCLENIYGTDKQIEEYLRIETYYERLHKGKGSQIHYVKWEM